MGQGPYGPGPKWARAHMDQGPYGPRPIWAPGPGPLALPCWANTSPKNAPWKKESKLCFFCVFLGNKKDARRPYDHFGGGIAPRSLLCVRKRRFPFLKKDLILSVIWSVICPRNLPRNLPSEFATKKWSRKCPSNPTSTCAGGQDDVSSQVNSLKTSFVRCMVCICHHAVKFEIW